MIVVRQYLAKRTPKLPLLDHVDAASPAYVLVVALWQYENLPLLTTQ
jgi:hypothetical protein